MFECPIAAVGILGGMSEKTDQEWLVEMLITSHPTQFGSEINMPLLERCLSLTPAERIDQNARAMELRARIWRGAMGIGVKPPVSERPDTPGAPKV